MPTRDVIRNDCDMFLLNVIDHLNKPCLSNVMVVQFSDNFDRVDYSYFGQFSCFYPSSNHETSK